MIRWATAVLILGLLAGGILYDRVAFAPEPEPLPIDERILTPALAQGDRLSNVWFCPVGSGGLGGYATHQISVSNLGEATAVANVDVVTDSGPGPGLRIEIPPLSTELVDLAALDPAPNLGAVVEIIGGLGVVGHTVTSQRGSAQGPCATDTSDTWYFAEGVTTRDATEFVALLNPFPEDAVFNMSFQTTSRSRVPQDLQAAVVPGRSVRVIEVGEFVTREDHVATKIETVQGELAVERLQIFDGSLGPVGATLQIGVADPALEWIFPAGRVHDGGDHRLVIYNPSAEVAEVDVDFDLDPGDRSSYGLVTIEASIQPGRTVVLDLREVVVGYGLPLPYEFGVRVLSANDLPIVAERWQVTPMIDTSLIGAGGSDARIVRPGSSIVGGGLSFGARIRFQDGDNDEVPEDELPSDEPTVLLQPTATIGVASSRGVETFATDWVVPWVTIDEGNATAVVATGIPGTLIEVRLMLAGELLPPVRATISDDGRVAIPMSLSVTSAPLLISATEPVAVEVQVVVPDDRLDVVPAVPVLDQ